jgi:hypothetical protein
MTPASLIISSKFIVSSQSAEGAVFINDPYYDGVDGDVVVSQHSSGGGTLTNDDPITDACTDDIYDDHPFTGAVASDDFRQHQLISVEGFSLSGGTEVLGVFSGTNM